jgi:DNA-binding CsgD family transcriptional regulator
VELVRLYSNPKSGPDGLPELLDRATSTSRPYERPAARQAQVRLDARQADGLAAAYRDGHTMKELAQLYGVHRTTVSALLRRLNVELGYRPRGVPPTRGTDSPCQFRNTRPGLEQL